MSWLQIHLTIAKEKIPPLELLLENMGAHSVTLRDAADQPLLEPMPGDIPLWNKVRLTGLFPNSANRKLISIAIEQTLDPNDVGSIVFEKLKDQVWERTWMQDFKPMRFGHRLLICPTEDQPPESGRTVVKLEPGLAFGTGSHTTTELCLCWLDAADLKGKSLMDFGCGSGILAIAALLLGADSVTAVDHDPQARQASVDNARKNGVSDRMRVCSNDEIPKHKVDIVVANILAKTLIELEPIFAAYMKKHGNLILSGVLREQVNKVNNIFSRDFDMQPSVMLDDWSLLIGIRQ